MTLLYLVVFSVAFIPKMELSLYFVGIYTAYGSIILATMIDIKNDNHQFLITLPISRKHIVRAKFITAVMYALIGVLASYGIHLFIKIVFPELNKPDFSALDILIPVSMVLVLVSIYLPLFYAFSKKGAGIINAVFMIALILLAQPAAMLLNTMNERGDTVNQMLYLFPIGTMLLLLASYYVTVYLFKKRDL